MINDNYFLPRDYVCNQVAISFDADNSTYWDKSRIETSLAFQHGVYNWALKLIRKNNFKKIADIGCGSAAKLSKLYKKSPNIEIWGFDQPNAISFCRKNYKFGNWIPLNFDKPKNLPETKFDLIISSDVIEHLGNPNLLMNLIPKFLNNNGYALISTPERNILRGPNCNYSPNKFHVREWAKDEFNNYLTNLGFKIHEHRCLPAYNIFKNKMLFKKALKRWVKGKSIKYNQTVLLGHQSNHN